ncbi:archaellin/type IV pilin N-terminal domain-containing protein [Salarchaeum sp. III]
MGERGQIGVETLIVFIALILVAVLGAGILVHTAGLLQSDALDAGEESSDSILDSITVYSVTDRPTTRILSPTLTQDANTLTNASVRIASNGETLRYDAYDTLTANISSGDSVTLVDDQTLQIEDGDTIAVRSASDGITIDVVDDSDTTELTVTDGDVTVENDTDGTRATLSLVHDDESISLAEGDTATVSGQTHQLDVLETRAVRATVSSGETVTLESLEGTIEIGDGDLLRFTSPDDSAVVTLFNENTSASLRGHDFEITPDGDGTDETITFSTTEGDVSYTESTLHDLVVWPKDSRLVPEFPESDDGEVLVDATTSSGGDVTLTDGGQTFTVSDGDTLDVDRAAADVLRLENRETGAVLTTSNDSLTLVDDDNGATLTLDRVNMNPITLYETVPSRILVEQETFPVDSSDASFSIYTGLSPGADTVNLDGTTIRVVGPAGARTLVYHPNVSRPGETFTVDPIVDADDTAPVLSSQSDRFSLRFTLTAPQRGDITVIITTPSGATRELTIGDA